MKNARAFLLINLLIFQISFAQTIEFKPHKLNAKLSFETLQMKNESNLGMMGIGADFYIFDKMPNLYITLNSYSAVTGNRPGLITFGTGLGYTQRLFNSNFYLDGGIFVGGGGGANAPDGGGLITREHLNLLYQYKKLGLFAGYSRMDFPTGEMGSNNFNFGLTYFSPFDIAHKNRTKDSISSASFSKSRLRVNLIGQNYFYFSRGPFSSGNSSGDFQLIGAEIDKFFSEDFYAALKLSGAVAGGVDGYMNILVGLGFQQNLWTKHLAINSKILAGPGGGGGIDSGGGAILQGSAGLNILFNNGLELNGSLGQTYAPNGNFSSTFVEFGLAKNFNFIFPDSHSKSIYSLKTNDKLEGFGFEVLNRTYFPTRAKDKSGNLYDKYFNLIGFKASKDLSPKFNVLGSTYWAYQGSYGAYAEGWLGVQYHFPIFRTWEMNFDLMGGAAGGGGINLGSGLAFQLGGGIHKTFAENWNLSLNFGKMQGLKGNFKPFYVDFGIGYNFLQVLEKNKF